MKNDFEIFIFGIFDIRFLKILFPGISSSSGWSGNTLCNLPGVLVHFRWPWETPRPKAACHVGFIWFTGHSPSSVGAKARTPGRNLKSGTETPTTVFCGLAPAAFFYHPGPPGQGSTLPHQSSKHPILAYKPMRQKNFLSWGFLFLDDASLYQVEARLPTDLALQSFCLRFQVLGLKAYVTMLKTDRKKILLSLFLFLFSLHASLSLSLIFSPIPSFCCDKTLTKSNLWLERFVWCTLPG